jgi:Polyribonucleotide nucleotidyltransferase (polynucleotide phosphorylase)
MSWLRKRASRLGSGVHLHVMRRLNLRSRHLRQDAL